MNFWLEIMFTSELPDHAVHFLVATQSGTALPQSKTLRGYESVRVLRQLLECARRLAVWVQAQTMKAAFSLTPALSHWEREKCFQYPGVEMRQAAQSRFNNFIFLP